MSFENTGLSKDVLRAVTDAGYVTPTPIQEKAIPAVLMGRDVLACAQTGTGKTASFTLPMIDILAHGRAKMRMPRSLILEPTRELAAQVADNFDTYGKYHKLSKALLIGGTDMKKQAKVLDGGTDVLIATPGRLLDMFERGHLLMRDIKILVIDEADRMLDMGFIPDIEKIVSMLPPLRQTLFFSATMAPAIKRIADQFLMNPKEISVSPPASTADTVVQGLLTLQPGGQYTGFDGKKKLKRDALHKLISHETVSDALVFCNRKVDISTVYKSLTKHGFTVGQLHGDMSQPARMDMLSGFKNKDFNILVCSDVAARGLDVPNLSHVFNYDVPSNAEDYVHRIGRTGRAGKEGHAYTIALPEDGKYVAAIEKLIGKAIPKIEIEGFETGTLSDESPSRGRENGGRGTGGRGTGGRGRSDGGRGRREHPPKQDTVKKDQNATPDTRPEPTRKTSVNPDNKHTKNHTEQRSREIHNQVCDGHMPAFLMRAPKTTPEKAKPEKAKPLKTKSRRTRKSPLKKEVAPKKPASSEKQTE